MAKSNKKRSKKKGTFEDTVDFLKSLGYEGEYIGENDTLSFLIKTDNLIISIFNRNYPHSKLADKIVADQKSNFDKWQDAYYFVEFPTSTRQREAIHEQLKEICNPYHTKRSSKYFEYFNR